MVINSPISPYRMPPSRRFFLSKRTYNNMRHFFDFFQIIKCDFDPKRYHKYIRPPPRTSDPPPKFDYFSKGDYPPPPTPGKLFFSLKNVPIIPSIISIFITDKQVKFLSQKALQWLIPPPHPEI